jgi:hypothetical protein
VQSSKNRTALRNGSDLRVRIIVGACMNKQHAIDILKAGNPPRSLNRRQIVQGGLALTAMAVLPAGLGCEIAKASTQLSSDATSAVAAPSGGVAQTVPSGPMTEATLTVTTLTAELIGPAFAGLSYEKASLQEANLFTTSNADLIGMFKGLGASVLRIGGSSVDHNVWTPNGRGRTARQIAPSDVASLAAFVKATGWQCLYGINLYGATTGATTPALAAAEVAYAVEQFGSSLLGIEIGNEPDLWGMTLANYLNLWEQFRSVILASSPGVDISGAAASYNLNGWTIPYAEAVAPQGEITLLTQHYYRGSNSAPTSTAELLITPDGRIIYELSLLKACLQNTGIPCRIAECNSFDSGGVPGVSDSYASSLWVIDYLFNCAQGGSCGANFHGGGNSPGYTPIADLDGTVIEARPLYYGILFFTLAGQGLVYATQVSAGSLNVTAYAVQPQSGGLNLVIVNKDPTQNLQLTAQLPKSFDSASLLQMTQWSAGNSGPELTATEGVTIQGATVNLGGTFVAGAAYSLNTNGSQISCYVPALSAVLIQAANVNPEAESSSTPTLVSVYLRGEGNATTVVLGNTLQFIAYGVYSDGSVGTLPDAYGNNVSRWDTNNHPVAKINNIGVMDNYSVGVVQIKAQIGSMWVNSSNVKVIPQP